jgi:hypothetical protein
LTEWTLQSEANVKRPGVVPTVTEFVSCANWPSLALVPELLIDIW